MEKILVCHRGALGDFILAWPALRLLRGAFPGCSITALGRPEYCDLAVSLGLIDTFHDAESSVMMPFFAGTQLPPVLAGHSRAFIWLQDGTAPAGLLEAHGTRTAVLAPFPGTETVHTAAFHLRTMSSLVNARAAVPPAAGNTPVDNPHGPILIHPGSGSTRKNFAPYLYADIADALAASRPGNGVQIVLGPVERGLIHAFTGRNLPIVQPKNVKELARLINGAALYIGNDAGATHLAGFMGIPVIALFRTTDPAIWGITGPCVRNLTCKTEDAALEQLDLAVKEMMG